MKVRKLALELLLRYHMYTEQWNSAISYGLQLLCHDPLLEHIHLELMRCYCAKGNRPAAINQYLNCRRLLKEELGVSPSMETEQTYRTLISHQYSSSDWNKEVKDYASCTNQYVISTVNQALGNIRETEYLLIKVSDRILKDRGSPPAKK